MKSIPDFEKLEGDRLEAAPNFCEKNEVIINVLLDLATGVPIFLAVYTCGTVG